MTETAVATVGEPFRKSWSHAFLAIVTILVGIMTVALVYLLQQTSRANETAALDYAARYAQALAEFRTLYTSEVVERVRGRGIAVFRFTLRSSS